MMSSSTMAVPPAQVAVDTALESASIFLSTTLLGRLAALEKRFADLESSYNELSSAKSAIEATSPFAQGVTGAAPTPTDLTKTKEVEPTTDDKPPSRVKIIVSKRDGDGEPTETPGELPPTKKEEPSDHAFVLKKITYPKTSREYEPASEIDIINPQLWKLLKDHLAWYPHHIFRESPVTLESPFEAIIFSWDNLLAASRTPADNPEDLEARTDLQLLLDTISGGSSGDANLDKYFKAKDSSKSVDQKMIQFTDLWTIFPPGTFIYGRPFQDQEQVFIVRDNVRPWPSRNDESGMEYLPWILDAYSYDWHDGSFGRKCFTLTFESFDGHVPLNSLPYFPFEHHKDKDVITEKLIQRGKKFQQLCKATNATQMFRYDGEAIPEKRGFSGMQLDDQTESEESLYLRRARSFAYGREPLRTRPVAKSSRVIGSVMVDYASYFEYGPTEGRNGELPPSARPRAVCGCADCQTNTALMRTYRSKFDKNANHDLWFDEQYLICPPRVLGYILVEKVWAQLQVSSLDMIPEEDKDDVWNSRLQLAQENTKNMLFNLVRSHSSPGSDNKLEVDDIVRGKGKGLVILLYGPPGVGKTSTAETIAVAARRPLFAVSVADVGTKAKYVEANLSKIFAMATSWEAILLIDEADVFLESRGRGGVVQSTEKNALVSVFLRVLEYYQGIMFLTTNQIAEFDIAIPSRIHVAIQYESLKEDQMMKIFKGFLKTLNTGNLIHDYDNILEWLQEDVYGEKLDGRQIRNVVTVALNLARAEERSGTGRGKLTKQHMKDAFNNVKQFKREFSTQMDRYKVSQQKMIN